MRRSARGVNRDTRDVIKLVADASDPRLLGASMLADGAADAIQTAVLAIRHTAIDELADTFAPIPHHGRRTQTRRPSLRPRRRHPVLLRRMTGHDHEPNRQGAKNTLTIAAVAAAAVCCAAPLLVAAGIVASIGVLLRNLALILLGTALIAWPVIRNRRRQTNKTRSHADEPAATDRT